MSLKKARRPVKDVDVSLNDFASAVSANRLYGFGPFTDPNITN